MSNLKKLLFICLNLMIIAVPVRANDEGINHFINSIIQDNVEEVAIYLEADNSPDVRDDRGNLALVIAVSHKHLQIVRILLESQANPNLFSSMGITALMQAAQQKHLGIMRLLLQSGADINLQNPYNAYTALMYAVENNYVNGVQLLMDWQAKLNFQNKKAETALSMAQAHGYQDIVTILTANHESVPSPENVTPPFNQTRPIHPYPAPLAGNAAEYINKANYLAAQEHVYLAVEVLKEGYFATQKSTLLWKWFELTERVFNPLKIKNKKVTLTQRQPDSVFKQSWFGWLNQQRQYRYELAHPIPTLPLTEVNQVVEEYERLKLTLLDLGALLQKHIYATLSEEMPQMESLLSKYKAMVEDVKRTRYSYLSFDVFSPYLARTEQLVFLSENANLFSYGYSPEILQQAAQQLVLCAHQSLLLEAEPLVWKQFFNIYQIFKASLRKKTHFQELAILQKLSVKLTTRQALGPEIWWK
jgi:hypothetical protein